VHSGGYGEMVDERLRGECTAHVRRRGGRVPELCQCRRLVRPDVIGPETVERHDHRHRVSTDGLHSGHRDREDRGDRVTLHGCGWPAHGQRWTLRRAGQRQK